MGDSFNPYSAWLGIAGAGRPDHYALLGVPTDTSDAQRIALAADQRIAQLRKAATKERLADAKALAQEILAARNCLLSPADRAAYDARLRAPQPRKPSPVPAGLVLPPRAFDDDAEDESASEPDGQILEGVALPPEPRFPPAEQVASPPVAAPTESPPVSHHGAAFAVHPPRETPARKRTATLPLVMGGALLGAIGVLAALLAPGWLRDKSSRVAANESAPATERGSDPPSEVVAPEPATSPPADGSQSSSDEEPAPEESDDGRAAATPPSDNESAPPGDDTDAMTPTDTDDQSPPAPVAMTPPDDSAPDHATTRATLSAARKSMGEGDVAEAANQIDLADLEATDTGAAELVAHDRAVLEYLKGFWNAVDEGFKQLAPGMEFDWEGRTVVVVERTADRLIIRAAGRNRAYERKKIPSNLALFLANRWLKQDDAATPLFLAAFHLLDADGDRDEARRLLEAARSAGTPGADDLLPELEVAP